jgi:hypothetical protein
VWALLSVVALLVVREGGPGVLSGAINGPKLICRKEMVSVQCQGTPWWTVAWCIQCAREWIQQ